ncbi:MAG: precorrin-2 C(20)-methyltransferase [Thaumarchaeota archaeon]|nr:precorrin-2 C(20)-methyltransferase [Nitrososphaerota archaeon]MCY3975917.1 precorrin-2 C(20)-methyltransferase [Nitrososphaerota archaeon]
MTQVVMYELTCVGCGPGDPDLLTIKAVDAIKKADIIICPTSKTGKTSMALSIISKFLLKRKPKIVNLVFPMVTNKRVLDESWDKNSKILIDYVLSGKNTIYITIGDPHLYSTWIYMHKKLEQNYPQIKIKVIPGITSIFTFAAKAKIGIGEAGDKIAIIPSCYDLSTIQDIAKNCDTLAFLKDGRHFGKIIKILSQAGFSEDSKFIIGQDLDTEKEIIRKTTLGKITKDTLTTKYFSIMVVKRA